MRRFVIALAAMSAMEGIASAQQCATIGGPACAAPVYAPGCAGKPESAPNPESAPRQPEGAYIRGPESGEFEGGASSFGLKGFGFKLPAISFDGPELRLPHLTRYRKNPVFHSESARAPFVRGPVSEFSQVPRNESAPESAPATTKQPESSPAPYQCIPPGPVPSTSANEKRLRDELARKEAEIRQLQDKFGQLESVVNRMAESRESEVSMPVRRRVKTSAIVEAGYHENDDEEQQQPARQVVSTRGTRAAVAGRPASAPRPSTSISRNIFLRSELEDDVAEVFAEPNVGYSKIVGDEETSQLDRQGLGTWQGQDQRPVTNRNNGSAKRSSR